MLLLLYQSLRALQKEALPNRLVRRIYELRIMAVNGEYTKEPPLETGDSARYAWEYVIAAPLEKLYTFILNEESFREFEACVERNMRRHIDREFHSLEILRAMF